jgi:predicted ABC-type ATPase
MTIVAGPNGSGKTTLTRHLAQRGINLGTYINPDDIAVDLTGPDAERSWKAQFAADKLRHDCLHQGVDFTFETVMSHPSKVEFMRKAKGAGYFVQLIFVGIEDPAINVARVKQRVSLGGHDVPTERIVDRWQRTMAALPDAIRASNRALLFDNTATIAKPGDSAIPRAVAECANGKLVRLEAPSPPQWLSQCLAQIAES